MQRKEKHSVNRRLTRLGIFCLSSLLHMMFVVLFLFILILWVFYVKKKYFTLHGPIPGISPQFLFGNFIQTGILFHGVSLPQALAKLKQQFGDVFHIWLGATHFISINNINDVQYIYNHRHIYDHSDFLFENFGILFPDGMGSCRGAKYKRHALVIMPLFRRAKIIPHLDTIVECTDQLLHNWRQQSDQQVHTDIVEQCQKLLLGIFGFIAFDYDLHTLDYNKEKMNDELKTALNDLLFAFRILIYSPKFVSLLYTKFSPRFQRSQKFLKSYVNKIVDQELTNNSELILERKRTCFIASLVASLQQDEKAEATKKEEEKKGLTRNEVLNEILGFLVAGYETTASALSWFIHLVSKHPRVQQKIKEELIKDGAQHALTIDRLESMVYLDCVIKEVLRFCPPADGGIRTLTVDDRLPESGFQLHKGDSVFIAFHNLARDTRYWSIDPELFYPERFLSEDKNHPPMAFLPFGNGHRQCAGRDLAQFELKVIAARFMQYVTFGDGGSEVNAGGHLAGMTVMPKYVGVTINFD